MKINIFEYIIIQKCLADMGTGITNVIGGPHDFLPPWSDRSDKFQKLWYFYLGQE
jgi:hypothetical protein